MPVSATSRHETVNLPARPGRADDLEDLDLAAAGFVDAFTTEDPVKRRQARDELIGFALPFAGRLARRWVEGRFRREATGEGVYCAQLVAITFRRMGLLDPRRPSNWYDPGKFWSGDRLQLADGASLGGELAVVDD